MHYHIMLGIMVLLCTGCGVTQQHIDADIISSQPRISYPPVTISSYNDRGEAFESTYHEVPQRVVSVWQNSIETVIALGEGRRIIAGMGVPDRKYIKPEYRVDYDAIPYKSLEFKSLESILMMKPDLLIGWRSTFTPKDLQTVSFWERRGVHVYVAASSVGRRIETQTIETEYQYIRDLGHIFHKEKRAEELVQQMEASIAKTISQTAEAAPQKVAFVELQGKDLRLYGRHTLAGNIGERLHGQLVDTGSPSISMEELLTENPDVIFLIVSDGSYDEADRQLAYLQHAPSLQRVKAVQEGRIHILPLLAVYSPGIRLSDGIEIVSHGLYPTIYPEGVPNVLHEKG